MSEGIPIPEAIPNDEEIKAKKVALEERLKSSPDLINDSGFRTEIIAWVDESQRWVTSVGTARANIVHNLRLMDLYRAGGDMDTALSSARHAYFMATAE